MCRHAALALAAFLLSPVPALAGTEEIAPPSDAPSPVEHDARAAAARENAPPGSPVDVPGLVEVARIEFDPPFSPDGLVVGFDDGLVYGFDAFDRLVAIDARTARPAGWSPVGDWSYGGPAIAEEAGGRRIAARGQDPGRDPEARIRFWDVTDPADPVTISEDWSCGRNVLLFPGGEIAFNWGNRYACLFDVATGNLRYDLGHGWRSPLPATVRGRPTLFLRRYTGTGRETLAAFDVAYPSRPFWQRELDPGTTTVIDRAGEALVLASGAAVVFLDPRDGTQLGMLPTDAASPRVALAEGGGRRVLAFAYEDAVRLFDISDPAEPSEIGSPLPLRVLAGGGSWAFASRPLVPHPDRPWIAAATVEPSGVAVIDTRDGSIVAETPADPDVRPNAVVWTALADGSPAFAWIVRKRMDELRVAAPEGGKIRVETWSMAVPVAPERVAVHAPVSPATVQRVVPIGGRFAVAADLSSNAVLLLDLADGTILDARGPEGWMQVDRYGYGGLPAGVASGGTVALGDRHAIQVWEVEEGRLRPREFIGSPPYARRRPVAVLSDGTVVATQSYPGTAITTHPPGAPGGEAALSFPPDQVTVDPVRERVVAASGSVWAGPTAPSAAVDLTDRAAPRVLWTREDGAAFATFVRGGEAVALTKRIGWRYAPVLHDPATGAPLGEPLHAADPFYYFAPTVAFGEGDGARLLYWQWTFCCWRSTLFDVSKDDTALVAVSEEYSWDPFGIARDDGRSAYEFRRASTRLVGPDGNFAPFDDTSASGLARLRHGFLVGTEFDQGTRAALAVTVLRDPAVNRPPIADAGSDAVLECADRVATPTVLDGSASSDPDSTPGTEDDLAFFAWSIDGVATDEGATVETTLAIGPHEVRLAVADVLGATGEDVAAVEVRDTRPPEVTVALRPEIVAGNLRTRAWVPEVAADDRCDGALAAETVLGLDREVLDAPFSWTLAGAPAIEIVDGCAGLVVRLLGPDRAALEAVWARAREEDGLRVPPGPLELSLEVDPPRGGSRAPFAVYALDSEGRVVVATAYGEGVDHRIAARATDLAGNGAAASASLRATIETLCAEAPSSVECR